MTRKENEAIIIAEKVRVVVAEIHGTKVPLGVEAPRIVVVDPEEIHLRKLGPTRGPPEMFSQQEYDVLTDHARCEPMTFYGRPMYVREGSPLPIA